MSPSVSLRSQCFQRVDSDRSTRWNIAGHQRQIGGVARSAQLIRLSGLNRHNVRFATLEAPERVHQDSIKTHFPPALLYERTSSIRLSLGNLNTCWKGDLHLFRGMRQPFTTKIAIFCHFAIRAGRSHADSNSTFQVLVKFEGKANSTSATLHPMYEKKE